MEYEIYKTNELYHHGILGMKWGVRRYQNKDGTLTAAGKRKLKKESAVIKKEEEILKNRKATKNKFDRLTARRKAIEDQKKELDGKNDKDDNGTPVKKSIKDMTDAELRSETTRLQLEKSYKDALQANAPAVKISRGRKFVNSFTDKIVESAAEKTANAVTDLVAQSLKSVGAKYINDYLGKTIGDSVEKVHANNKK